MTDAVQEARNAGLRYVTDRIPGIRRTTERGRFRYSSAGEKRIRDRDTLQRIARLAIPPAYRDVWICPYANGHLQATGRDARGRKQYRYHRRWREVRDATKYERLLEFAGSLPRTRKAVARDLAKPGLPKEKVLAAVVALLETTLIRVGNEEYARANDSFGLTTLRNRHARVRGAKLRFEFKGKSGLQHRVDLHDRRLARIVAQCQDLPGQHLFSFLTDEGNAMPIDSADVNEYIRSISGDDFSAKDFRTWLATVCCARWLSDHPASTAPDRAHGVVEAAKAVAKRLGNTPAICRKCYIHPILFERYVETGSLPMARLARNSRTGLQPDERSALALLRALASRRRRVSPLAGRFRSLDRYP
jgi:DNA topoisomerase-1